MFYPVPNWQNYVQFDSRKSKLLSDEANFYIYVSFPFSNGIRMVDILDERTFLILTSPEPN